MVIMAHETMLRGEMIPNAYLLTLKYSTKNCYTSDKAILRKFITMPSAFEIHP